MMIWFIFGCMIAVQAIMACWLFWLDQEYKALNRYVQGLRVPT